MLAARGSGHVVKVSVMKEIAFRSKESGTTASELIVRRILLHSRITISHVSLGSLKNSWVLYGSAERRGTFRCNVTAGGVSQR